MTLNDIMDFVDVWKGKDVTIVADGLSCPIVDADRVIAVNHAFYNCFRKPDILVFNDAYFLKELGSKDVSDFADYVVHGSYARPLPAPNVFPVKLRSYWSPLPNIYGSYGSGVTALSLAVIMGASVIHLYGYDYRIFTDEESMELFGRPASSHRSAAAHRNDCAEPYLERIHAFELFSGLSVDIINHSMHSNIPYFRKAP